MWTIRIPTNNTEDFSTADCRPHQSTVCQSTSQTNKSLLYLCRLVTSRRDFIQSASIWTIWIRTKNTEDFSTAGPISPHSVRPHCRVISHFYTYSDQLHLTEISFSLHQCQLFGYGLIILRTFQLQTADPISPQSISPHCRLISHFYTHADQLHLMEISFSLHQCGLFRYGLIIPRTLLLRTADPISPQSVSLHHISHFYTYADQLHLTEISLSLHQCGLFGYRLIIPRTLLLRTNTASTQKNSFIMLTPGWSTTLSSKSGQDHSLP